MENEAGISLPKDFEITELIGGPRFEDGDEILRNYCCFCQLEDSCEMTRALRYAMGNDIPYWNGAFVPVRTEVPAFPIKPDSLFFRGNPNSSDTEWHLVEKDKIFCTEYRPRNLQLHLQGIPTSRFLEGVERLVAVVRQETERILEVWRDLNERGVLNPKIIEEEKKRAFIRIYTKKKEAFHQSI